MARAHVKLHTAAEIYSKCKLLQSLSAHPCMQEGKEVMTVARLNSRIQSMTALEGALSGPDSPASESTALPCLNPSPAVSVQVLVPVLRRSQSEGATLPQSLLDWHMSPQSWQDGMSIALRVYCPAIRGTQHAQYATCCAGPQIAADIRSQPGRSAS